MTDDVTIGSLSAAQWATLPLLIDRGTAHDRAMAFLLVMDDAFRSSVLDMFGLSSAFASMADSFLAVEPPRRCLDVLTIQAARLPNDQSVPNPTAPIPDHIRRRHARGPWKQ